MRCLESLRITLGDITAARPLPSLRGQTFEEVVALLHGEWPRRLSTPRAQSDFLYEQLQQEFGRELHQATALAGFYASLLRVDHVSDHPDAIATLLRSTVYQGVEWGTRAFVTGPIRPLHTPLQYIVVCLVGPRSA